MPSGEPMGRLVLWEDLGARILEIWPKSYRPVPGGQRRDRERADSVRQRDRCRDLRTPGPIATGLVQRRERLRSLGVDDGEARPALGGGKLRDSPRQRVQRGHARERLGERLGERAGSGDPDAKPGERAGADPDGDPVHAVPPPGIVDGALDLAQQLGGVTGVGAAGW